jgi:hypothetical protein
MTQPPKKGPSTNSPELPDLPDPQVLHQATDKLNAALLDAQKALADLKLGVTAYVLLEEEDESLWFKSLGFEKLGGEFKLVIHEGHHDEPDRGSTTELTSASRESRLQAVRALPKLYRKLLNAFDTEVDRVNKSITEVHQLTTVIRAKAGK